MRSSLRYEKKQYRRGLFSEKRQARLARGRCKLFTAALLLLFGIFWLTTRSSSEKHIDESTAEKTSKEVEASWKSEVLGEQEVVQTGRDGGEDGYSDSGKFPPKITGHGSMLRRNESRWQVRNVVLNEDAVCDRSKYPTKEELLLDQLTILVNGYSESRLQLLQSQVQIYSALPFVHSIYILWGNISTSPEVLDQWSFTSLGAAIFIVRQDSASLNDRFLPRDYIKTSAVMICDDDITVDAKSLRFALDVWKEHEGHSIVGFFPRAHLYDHESESWMYVKQQGKYSIMLTKLMILATEFLYLYTCEMPSGIKEYVDKGMNCEDIAMNFLVSSSSGKGPILVEGKARDWGDPRNSGSAKDDDELASRTFGALSARKDHRKHRGDCITAFAKLWKGMELRYSYSKASANLENEVQCEKFGHLVDCDSSVVSNRDVRRLVGENVITTANRFAYATFVPNDTAVNASLILMQTLRTSGTINDLVLLMGPSCSPISGDDVLYQHFDEIVRVDASQHGKLSVWLQLQYAKVVYLEVDSFVVANLDHLFQLPELAAAPCFFSPGEFCTGLLVLKPSNETYVRLVQSIERIPLVHNKSRKRSRRHYLLNSYFDGWYQMPAENRLPARYNVPIEFPKRLKLPAWFNPDNGYDSFGPLMVVRFGHSRLFLGQHDSGVLASSVWLTARLKLFQSLQENALRPLDSDNISHWVPTIRRPSQQADLTWPILSHSSLPALGSSIAQSSRSREAFVTVLYDDQILKHSPAGWAESFHHHHSFRSRPKIVLMVLSSLSEDWYRDYGVYFDDVRVVEPISSNGAKFPPGFTLLHLWNQTDFDKLVYVSATSLFMQNCNSLLDFAPFAAVPSLFPPDTFSTHVMSIQPSQQTYDSLQDRLVSYESSPPPVDRFLNDFYPDWYQESYRHRMSPSYRVSIIFEAQVQTFGVPWKIASFDSEWLPDEEANVIKLWKETVCGLKPAKIPNLVMSVCGSGGAEAI